MNSILQYMEEKWTQVETYKCRNANSLLHQTMDHTVRCFCDQQFLVGSLQDVRGRGQGKRLGKPRSKSLWEKLETRQWQVPSPSRSPLLSLSSLSLSLSLSL